MMIVSRSLMMIMTQEAIKKPNERNVQDVNDRAEEEPVFRPMATSNDDGSEENTGTRRRLVEA